jgi:hypothetical protein
MFLNHYKYLKHVIENVLEIKPKTQEELNYCIYLIDRDYLPQKECDIVSCSFRLHVQVICFYNI